MASPDSYRDYKKALPRYCGDAFTYCIANKGLRVHAWCIMSNHIHCILSIANGTLSDTIRDLKRHTAKQILLSVQSEPESRRDWLL
ncbi:transposase [Parasediminibacterium paludis]|uniref:Transposase n=1 Tax=Parasediminibacterium paludis TaxID=908966 RepID=A0ABV8Q0K2_9BACT